MKEANHNLINRRAVVYCRVSTKEQVDEGNSLSTQEKICRDYALKNSYEVVELFIEQGESAKTQDRPELRRLLDYCSDRKNKINAVIAYKLDRISRNIDDYSYIRIVLKNHGVEIKSTSENFENTPAGKFMENMIANVAQFDNDVRAERSINGMRDAMRDGRYVWMAPVGYNNIRIAGKCTIAPNKKLGPIVKRAFELIAQNTQPLEAIRMQMIKEGLTNKAGKPLCKSYFYYFLRNELYAGWIIKCGERHKGTFDAIVPQETFDQVQRVLKFKGRKHSQYITDNPGFPLRRFIVNHEGRKLTGSWSKGRSKKYPFYRFGGKNSNYNRDKFNEAFIDFMNSFSLNDSLYKKLKGKVEENLSKEYKNKEKETERLKKYISDLTEKQSKLIEQNYKGIISEEALKNHSAIVDKEIMESHAALAVIPTSDKDYSSMIQFAEEYVKNPGKIWSCAPIDTQLELQWFQFPSGCIFDGKNFGTGEVSSFFKAKNIISSTNSYLVPSRLELSNKSKIKSNKQHIDNTTFWEQFGNDLNKLFGILKKIPKYDSS